MMPLKVINSKPFNIIVTLLTGTIVSNGHSNVHKTDLYLLYI